MANVILTHKQWKYINLQAKNIVLTRKFIVIKNCVIVLYLYFWSAMECYENPLASHTEMWCHHHCIAFTVSSEATTHKTHSDKWMWNRD